MRTTDEKEKLVKNIAQSVGWAAMPLRTYDRPKGTEPYQIYFENMKSGTTFHIEFIPKCSMPKIGEIIESMFEGQEEYKSLYLAFLNYEYDRTRGF